jgi:hypothetical protein
MSWFNVYNFYFNFGFLTIQCRSGEVTSVPLSKRSDNILSLHMLHPFNVLN